MKRIIISALFLIAMLCLFLPWIGFFPFDTRDLDVQIRGIDILSNRQLELSGTHQEAWSVYYNYLTHENEPVVIWILITSIMGILSSFIKWKKVFIVQIAIGLAGIVLLVTLHSGLDYQEKHRALVLSQFYYLPGYKLAIIAFVVATTMSFFTSNFATKLLRKILNRLEPGSKSITG